MFVVSFHRDQTTFMYMYICVRMQHFSSLAITKRLHSSILRGRSVYIYIHVRVCRIEGTYILAQSTQLASRQLQMTTVKAENLILQQAH